MRGSLIAAGIFLAIIGAGLALGELAWRISQRDR